MNLELPEYIKKLQRLRLLIDFQVPLHISNNTYNLRVSKELEAEELLIIASDDTDKEIVALVTDKGDKLIRKVLQVI